MPECSRENGDDQHLSEEKFMSLTKRSIALTSLVAAGVMLATVASGLAGHETPSQHPSHSGSVKAGAPASGVARSPITSGSTAPGNGGSKVPHQQ